MGRLKYSAPKSKDLLIGITCWILFAFFLLATALFAFSVTQVIICGGGTVFSEDSSLTYKAPAKASLKYSLVKEGDRVSQGDTLMVLHNEELNLELEQIGIEIKIAKDNLALAQDKMNNLYKHRDYLIQDLKRHKKKYKATSQQNSREYNRIVKQIDLIKLKVAEIEKQTNSLKELYESNAITGTEYRSNYFNLLDEKDNLSIKESELYAEMHKGELLNDNYELQNSETYQKILTNDSDILGLKQSILDLNKSIATNEIRYRTTKATLKKLVQVADFDGTVSNLIYLSGSSNFIEPNEILLKLEPLTSRDYHTYLTITDKDEKFIQPGQTVNLRIAGHNHYKFGVIRGKVINTNYSNPDANTGIPNRQVLVSLDPLSNKKIALHNGINATGNVVIGEMKLYKVFLSSVFGI